MNDFERAVRTFVVRHLRDTGSAPGVGAIAGEVRSNRRTVGRALRSLADQHCLALRPDGETIWMVHPFSAFESDFVVRIRERRWFANCVWDGLAILGLIGGGSLHTRCPTSGAPMDFAVRDGRVSGEGVVHFLVPAREFWDDIGFT